VSDLGEYARKRDFSRTPEPPAGSQPGHGRRFVVQKHDASRLHYDFRLEVNGVLRSWAVPKGPSTDPRDKRLAMPTEDHPLDYLLFEGVIPKGEYGGGTVIVWDTGTYENMSTSKGEAVPLEEALGRGHATFRLDGAKLAGGYALTRVARGKEERWLLVKKKDDAADPEVSLVDSRPESVLSGRTVEQVAEEEGGGET
jgi:DNA ligase D-like protein (predicted 3'-phosphoesterase)